MYPKNFPHNPLNADYNLVAGVKDNACPGTHDICDKSVGVVNSGVDTFDARLTAASPAIDAALPSAAPADDYAGRIRDAKPDIGAYEYAAGNQMSFTLFLPTVIR